MAKLPSAYQEVEYIQSSGNQYFSVLNSFKTSYKIVIDFQMVTTGGDYIPLGMIEPGTYYKYGIDAYEGYFKVTSGSSNWTNTKSEDKNRHTFIINKSTATVDGTNYSINYVDYTYNFGIGVFAYRTNKWEYASSNKLYKLDIYDENGVHIFDGYPCYRKSDNVIGMYDLVNDQFYTNSGSGTFTKGPNVEYPPEYKLHGHIGTWHMEHPLLSRSELTAIGTIANMLVELNKAPARYYNKFNSEGHIYNYTSGSIVYKCLSNDGASIYYQSGTGKYAYYNESTGLWVGAGGGVY